jgi:hypothetical protein
LHAPPPTDRSETLASWWQDVDSEMSGMVDDLETTLDGTVTETNTMDADCRQLILDARQLETAPSAPGSSIDEPFQAALVDVEGAGSECKEFFYTGNRALLEMSETDMTIAATELNTLFGNLANYLPVRTLPPDIPLP